MTRLKPSARPDSDDATASALADSRAAIRRLHRAPELWRSVGYRPDPAIERYAKDLATP